MSTSNISPDSRLQTRRLFLRRAASGLIVVAGGACLGRAGLLNSLDGAAFAEELVRTPWQTQGPFYPDKMPLDTDNDLIVINNSITRAVGAVSYLSGRVLDARGEPVSGALVEIWQVDNNGAYIHSGNGNGQHDANFQGYGRFETGKGGHYIFRTVKPVPYPGRTPHIHMTVWKGPQELLTTQVYVAGHPQNARDGILNGIRDARQRASVVVPYVPIKGSKIGELSARFDIVLGWTPEIK